MTLLGFTREQLLEMVEQLVEENRQQRAALKGTEQRCVDLTVRCRELRRQVARLEQP